jgi:YidC/Oxa1 family membrane protein insertase
MRRARLSILLLLLPLLAGCFGAGGQPLAVDRLSAIRDQFKEFDALGRAQIDARLKSLQNDVAQLAETQDRGLRAELGRKRLLIGYCWERRGDFIDAQQAYAQAANSEYGSVALMRTAQVAEYLLAESKGKSLDPDVSPEERLEASEIEKAQQKQAVKALERAANFPLNTRILVREPDVATVTPARWELVDIRHEAYRRLDKYYQEKLSYRIFEFLVQICGGEDKKASYLLTIILIAVLAKLITTPLSAAQFRNMQAMQALQPELKKIQEKYKDDKQKLGQAQMELFREHKVNPASSCLPMLIQMPILIWVYYGIRYFVYRFENVGFLYLDNLANPDVLELGGTLLPGPLVLLYGVSMYFSQKLLQTPTGTPEQQQQQKMMSYMMPVLLVIILKGLPAAFILYWFLQNLLMTGHQYLLMRARRGAAVPAGGPSEPEPEPTTDGPPPEAVERLAQGSRPRRKKKKKRR